MFCCRNPIRRRMRCVFFFCCYSNSLDVNEIIVAFLKSRDSLTILCFNLSLLDATHSDAHARIVSSVNAQRNRLQVLTDWRICWNNIIYLVPRRVVQKHCVRCTSSVVINGQTAKATETTLSAEFDTFPMKIFWPRLSTLLTKPSQVN